MPGGIQRSMVVSADSADEPPAEAVAPWKSVRRTVALVAFGWGTAVGTAGIAYLTLGSEWIPIMVGVVLCLAFAVALLLLHRALWLTVLSSVPALFVLVGAVQYAPEAALELRGVRENVVIVADSAAGTSSGNHRFTLRATNGDELEEKLGHDGDMWVPKVGDRLDVIRDPKGVVPMEQADDVDAAGRMSGLISGTVGWTLIAILAGWRGHVRRRRGHGESLLLQLAY
ncbi:hypothetical protein ACFYN9_14220 [Streptomyces collinus]|uniref:Uncharacterized protein n=2 Tax=Streptomyces collinus TaxID=42684 RepID=A0AA89TR71_STRCU|nr:hypothetical protein [Streptomyces collinus]MBB5809830.1 hypothetical protein [Streptomyces collinus]WMX63140.1 hypothetical protein RFN52_07210 [Streptomyces collinus]